MRILKNVLCQVVVTALIAKFLILDIPIDRDSLIVVGRGFLRMISGIVNTPERLFSTFDGFCHQTFRVARSDVIRKTESDSDDEEDYQIKRNKFGAPIYGSKPAPYLNLPLKQVNWKPDYKGSYTKEEEATGQWRTEIRVGIPRPPRASMQDLYDRMGRMEIHQEGTYNPPGYAQPQYDQYYQQYPPPPPQYQQQHQDDDE
ncbi:hypothetical protein Tco_0145416 [Tanacetum coccineum]